MITKIVILQMLVGSACFADIEERSMILSDFEVDNKARRWGEEVVNERGASSQHEALTQWRKAILNCEQLPEKARIELLIKALDKISRFSIYQVAERIEIYDLAREKMTSIPDHANYFTDKIEESWNSNAEKVRKIEFPPDWETKLEKLIQSGSDLQYYMDWQRAQWGNYEEIRSENLRMLGHIPSKESVRALGYYLRERNLSGIKIEPPVTGELAAGSLSELISDGPTRTGQSSWEDVPKWQQWFDEVKAGKRTFRFVGSDVDYTLDGPANAKTLKNIGIENSGRPRPNKRMEDGKVSATFVKTIAKSPAYQYGLIAGIGLALASLVFVLKRKSSWRF